MAGLIFGISPWKQRVLSSVVADGYELVLMFMLHVHLRAMRFRWEGPTEGWREMTIQLAAE